MEQTAVPGAPRLREGPPQELGLLVQCRILLELLKRHPFRQLEHSESGRVLHVVAHGEGEHIPRLRRVLAQATAGDAHLDRFSEASSLRYPSSSMRNQRSWVSWVGGPYRPV